MTQQLSPEDEIGRDALASLEGAGTDAPPVYPPTDGAWAPPPSAESGAPRPRAPTRPQTLEDLYAVFPDIGAGGAYLRVERTAPQKWHGHVVQGWIGDLYEQIPMADFVERFGGHKYTINVIQPSPDGSSPRSRGKIELSIPAEPVLSALPRRKDENDMMRGPASAAMPGMGFGAAFPPSERVQVTQLQMAEAERKREHEEKLRLQHELLRAHQTPDQALHLMAEQYKQALDNAQRQHEAREAMLRQQIADFLNDAKAHSQEEKRLRDEIISLQRAVAESQRATETEQIRQLKERFEQDTRAKAEEHARTIQRLHDEHTAAIQAVERGYRDERDRYMQSEQRERERTRDDFSRREEQTKVLADARERSMKDSYEARIVDMQRNFDRELAATKDSYERAAASTRDAHARELASLTTTHATQLESIRSMERTAASTAENSAKLQVSSAESQAKLQVSLISKEVESLRAEVGLLKEENRDLRAKQNKDPVQFIKETRDIASGILGMVDGAGAAEKATDWKEKLGEGLVTFLQDGVPKLAQTLMQVRESNQQQRQVARVQAAQAAQQAQLAQFRQAQLAQQQFAPPVTMPMQMMPQQMAAAQAQAQAQGRRRAAPPPSWAQQAPPGMAVPMAGSVGIPYQAPIPPPTTGFEYAQASPVTAPPGPVTQPAADQKPQPMSSQAVPVAQPIMSQPAAPGAVQTAPTEAQPQSAAPPLQQQQVIAFIEHLDHAIGENQTPNVPVAAFAQMLVAQAGREQIADLLQRVKPEDLFELIEREAPPDKLLNLRGLDGQQYVRALWVEAGRLVA